MRHIKRRLEWIRNGLFWRTFILLTFLTTASMVAWFASYSIVERGPQSEQLAAQIVSVVTITRAALTHSAPEMRRELLFDLASNEGIRIYRKTTSSLAPCATTSSRRWTRTPASPPASTASTVSGSASASKTTTTG